MANAAADPLALSVMAGLLHSEDEIPAPTPERQQSRRRLGSPQSVVYYIRLHDFVKIGTTTNLANRVSGLQAARSDVLATEPGNVGLKSIRCDQFAKFRVAGRSDDFRAVPELLEHCADTRRLNGDPIF